MYHVNLCYQSLRASPEGEFKKPLRMVNETFFLKREDQKSNGQHRKKNLLSGQVSQGHQDLLLVQAVPDKLQKKKCTLTL